MVKSPGKCDLENLYGESNEINGEQNCFEFDRREKNCLLLIRF